MAYQFPKLRSLNVQGDVVVTLQFEVRLRSDLQDHVHISKLCCDLGFILTGVLMVSHTRHRPLCMVAHCCDFYDAPIFKVLHFIRSVGLIGS
jgi:hypothetical protein